MDCILVTFEQVASALEGHASVGQTICYNDFADEVGLPRPNNLFANSAVKAYFEQIDWNDAQEQRPFRTALVVLKSTGRPGMGFYKSIALHRGTQVPASEQAEFWQREISDLFDYYQPGQANTTLQIELSRAQAARLMRLCNQAKRTPELLIESGLTTLLGFLEHDFAMIQEADEQIERGEFYTSEAVFAHIKQILKKKP